MMENNNNSYGHKYPFIKVQQEPPIGHCHSATFHPNIGIPAAHKQNAIEQEIQKTETCLTYWQTYLKLERKQDNPTSHEIALVTSQIIADKAYLKSLKKMRSSRCVIS